MTRAAPRGVDPSHRWALRYSCEVIPLAPAAVPRPCRSLVVLLALLVLSLPTTGEVRLQASEGGAPAWGDLDPQSKLAARLAEAERLASSGDYATASTVLAEAVDLAAGDPVALDAVDRVQAQIEFRRGNYRAARERHQAVLQRASARRDLPGVAQAEMDLALLDRRQGDYTSALAGLERSLAVYRQLGNADGVARVLTHIGLVRLNQGIYSAALEALNESLRLQRDGAEAELERTYHYLGLLYAGLREYRTSRDFLERGLGEAHKLADPAREAPLLGSMARVANLSGAHSQALSIANESAKLAERMDSPPGRAYAGLERGRALLGLGRLDEAREALERGAAVAEQIGQRGTLADFRNLLAELAVREGRDEDALALWELVLPAYQTGDDQPQLFATYRAMIPVLQRRGQAERALQIALESLQVQEQISSLDMNRRLAVAESESRAREKERQIELLQRDNEIQALRLSEEVTRRSRALWLSASLIVIVLLLALRYRESRRMQRQLTEVNQDLVSSREALALAHTELEKRAEQLARAAATDPLTGVANRREFIGRFNDYWNDALRRRSELSLVLIDADNFKRINDVYGHAVGDVALCALAHTLQATLRQGTLLARWGGEEFIVVLPGAGDDAAAALGDRLRHAVAAIAREDLPPLTISIGIASLGGRSLERPEQLFDEADAALYEAKAGGRNRVCIAARPPVDGAVLH
jgi:diguanylate cyclase (GGDEF)-like protein